MLVNNVVNEEALLTVLQPHLEEVLLFLGDCGLCGSLDKVRKPSINSVAHISKKKAVGSIH